MNVSSTFDVLREFLFPAGCIFCGGPLLDIGEYRVGLCSDCSLGLVPSPLPRCPRCGRPLISEAGVCMECRSREAPAYDAVLALFPYRASARKLFIEYKFGKARMAAKFISELMALPVEAGHFSPSHFDAIVPVPPRAGKLHSKGWDQVDHIVRALGRRTDIPVLRCLSRLPSRSQKELNRIERAVNLAGKILCNSPPPASILLVDDIITTGATLSVCAQALKEGGAITVAALTLCYD